MVDRQVASEPWKISKDAIIGAVSRGGRGVAQLAPKLTGRSILKSIRSFVNLKDSELVADEYQAYNLIGRELEHSVIKHREQYADGDTHTNTIEGFWLLLKRAWYGLHHHYQTGYTSLYVAEQCYKYNYRDEDIFAKFIREDYVICHIKLKCFLKKMHSEVLIIVV